MELTLGIGALDTQKSEHKSLLELIKHATLKEVERLGGQLPPQVEVGLWDVEMRPTGYFLSSPGELCLVIPNAGYNPYPAILRGEGWPQNNQLSDKEVDFVIAEYTSIWPIKSVKIEDSLNTDGLASTGFFKSVSGDSTAFVWVEQRWNVRKYIALESPSLDFALTWYRQIRDGLVSPSADTFPMLGEVVSEAVRLASCPEMGFEITLSRLEQARQFELHSTLKRLLAHKVDTDIARAIYSDMVEDGRPDAGWEDEDYVVETD